jgi:hypothetical protein
MPKSISSSSPKPTQQAKTTDPLSLSIQGIRESVGRLNELTDTAAKVVLRVEKFLNEKCSAGVEASVTVKQSRCAADDPPTYTKLKYARFGPRYRITVTEEDWTEGNESETVKPWSDWDRETKLETFGFLPELLTEIATRVDEQVQVAESAVAKVNKVLDSLAGQED